MAGRFLPPRHRLAGGGAGAGVAASTPSLRGAQRRSNPLFLSAAPWIASRSLSSGAHSRDPVARNDGEALGAILRKTARRANHPKPVQPLREKYSACRVGQISGLSPPVSPDKRGGSRSSRNARWDAVDVEAATDERGRSGRRRRVVLVYRHLFCRQISRKTYKKQSLGR